MNYFLQWLMSENHLAYASSLLTFICLILFWLGSFFYKKYLVKKGELFISPTFNTKNITYMGIMIACSVSVTVVISLVAPITVFPPIRVAFEGIMIKITGMIFGPIIGLIVGLITELLTMLFIPSFIHPAYFIVAIGFGFWAGTSSFAFKLKSKQQWVTVLVITVFILLATIFLYNTLQYLPAEDGKVKLFGLAVKKELIPTIFIFMMCAMLGLCYAICGIFILLKKQRWLQIILPTFLICIVTEILITVLVASWGDSSLLTSNSSDGYISMVALRVVQIPVKIIFNTILLSTVYYVLRPLIKNK
ncbi:ECF transporter S component [Mesoplasma chauliocola]|nr:ECF transporter S component [Mesoplasma chauliocola]